jgi:hypothetical protein
MNDSTSSAAESVEENKVDSDRIPFKIDVMKLDKDPIVLQMKVY